MKVRKLARRSALAGVLLFGIIWGGLATFTIAFAKFHDPESACMWRYWAVTWPVWKVMPESVAFRFVDWTLRQCGGAA